MQKQLDRYGHFDTIRGATDTHIDKQSHDDSICSVASRGIM